MDFPNVTSLYKYRTFNQHTEDMLRTGQIWVSKPTVFNDPFDCEIQVKNVMSKRVMADLFEVDLSSLDLNNPAIQIMLDGDFPMDKLPPEILQIVDTVKLLKHVGTKNIRV